MNLLGAFCLGEDILMVYIKLLRQKWHARFEARESIFRLWKEIVPFEKAFRGVDALSVAVHVQSDGFDSLHELEGACVDRMVSRCPLLRDAVQLVVQKANAEAGKREARKVRFVLFC